MGHGTESVVRHTFVTHRSPAELAAHAVPFIRGSVADGTPVYVNLPRRDLGVVQAALGSQERNVTWSDTDAWVPHPGRRLRAIEDLLAREAAANKRVSFLGACAWPTGPEPLVREWERFDAALNDMLTDYEASMCCVCDAAILPGEVVARFAEIHPQFGIDPPTPNGHHVDARQFLATARPEALPLPRHATCLSGRVTPGTARRFLHDAFAEAKVADERCDELTVVLSELVTNSCQAGAETITVAWWQSEHGLALQVDDDGRGFEEPLAGYRRPPADSEGGRGVWIARQLADVVEVVPRQPGVSVRVHLYDPAAIVSASTLASGAS